MYSSLSMGGIMCDPKKLKMLLDKQLDLDQNLELYDHLDRCESCRTALYAISRDRDKAFFVYRPYRFRPPKRKKLSAA
jgi:anti-sigma factor RsiW